MKTVVIDFDAEIKDAAAFATFFDLDPIYIDPDGNCELTAEVASRLPEFQAARDRLALDAAKQAAALQIDVAAETARQTFLTPGAGQALTYKQKEAEADAALGSVDRDPVDYPFLAACLGVDGDTIEEVAMVVRNRRDAWRTIGADIERRRLLAKQAIRTATNAPEIETILSTLTWPQPE